jgi:FlaA1/EpsC-like NDP-sugar epimerase
MEKIFNKKNIRVICFIALDILTIIISSVVALKLRFDLKQIPQEYINNLSNWIFLDIILMIIIYTIFKIYKSMWSYASIMEILYIVLANITFEIVQYTYKTIIKINMPKSYYLIQLMFLILIVSLVRFSYRIIRTLKSNAYNKKRKINTMLIGAGEAGKLLINEINSDKDGFNNRIKCIIDDDKNKKGILFKGIPVVGNRKDIKEQCERYNIQEIIIAIPSASTETISKIVEECQKTQLNIKILPPINKIVGQPTMKNVRKLSYEDFLGRNEIVVNSKEIKENIEDITVLITGGGGSIGSELCRQIAAYNPKQLIIFDIYENNAYDIEQELKRKNQKLELKTIIGSVRDYERLETVFKEYKPDVVFHAAAHKHVPLMEESPNEAIKNNCLGTLNAVKLADKYKVKKFVLISTDKAVRPTNIMGASKRICEMIIQAYDKNSKTEYVAVRFGNVLGSNGSVIPLFLKQIEEGGPVTVTHKEITRFFMTIPEAVNLILQAYVYAEGGEIFILDMGEPVKIYDLAKKIIRYKGFEPNVDIKIKITGLRPGEKLYEEMLMEEEGLKSTPNKLIHIGKPIKFDEKKFLKELDELIKQAYKNNINIKKLVAKIVDTYKIKGDNE